MSTPIGSVKDIRAVENAPEIEVALGNRGVIELSAFSGNQTLTCAWLGVEEAQRLSLLLMAALGEMGDEMRHSE